MLIQRYEPQKLAAFVHTSGFVVHDLAKFSSSQHKDRGLARGERAPNPYLCVKLAKSCVVATLGVKIT